MDKLESFLAAVPVFRELPAEDIRHIALQCREQRHSAGTLILRQGETNQAVFFLRSGRLAVRVQRAEGRETVAYLQPPAVFGELSFITGRACSADVEVVVDADVVLLPKEAVPQLTQQRTAILEGLMTMVAERLHDTVTRGTRAAESPVVLLRCHEHWAAPLSFARELGLSLSRQTGQEVLVVNFESKASSELEPLGDRTFVTRFDAAAADGELRARLAERLTEWKQRFTSVILNVFGSGALAIGREIAAFADYEGDLLGPSDLLPEEADVKHFAVQDAERPSLPFLSGARQLIWDAPQSERAFREGRPLSSRFLRTVDSIARFIADQQVGLALGGGAAWGWSHVGVLSVLEQARVPIDVMAGCSMGSVIGSLRCSGISVDGLREIAQFWRGRTRRFVEYRIWRMHLLKEKTVRKVFRGYFGDRTINQLEIPFWANAVDIKTGKEFTILDGPVVEAVRASIAMPGLLPPAARREHLLLDAGIMDPVPVNLVRRMGCRFAIAVNAMVPLQAQEMSTNYPLNIFDVMFRCMRVTGHEIGQARCEAAADVVLTPGLEKISMLDFNGSEEIIRAGERVAEENLPLILARYQSLRKTTRIARQTAMQLN